MTSERQRRRGSAPYQKTIAYRSIIGSFRPLTRDEAQRLVVPHLAGAILAHAPMVGPFGPSSEAIVVITTTAEAPPAEFGGFVLLPDGKVLKLPPFHEHWTGWQYSPPGDGDRAYEPRSSATRWRRSRRRAGGTWA
jgi:hypothetical protein